MSHPSKMGDDLAKPNLLRETENAHSISTPSGGLAMCRARILTHSTRGKAENGMSQRAKSGSLRRCILLLDSREGHRVMSAAGSTFQPAAKRTLCLALRRKGERIEKSNRFRVRDAGWRHR